MSETWNTKAGPRRVRRDPPTLREAIAAAQGLTDEVPAQIEIAAALIGVPAETVRAEMARIPPERKSVRLTLAAPRDRGMARTVIVERKPVRRMVGVRRG